MASTEEIRKRRELISNFIADRSPELVNFESLVDEFRENPLFVPAVRSAEAKRSENSQPSLKLLTSIQN